MPLVSHPELQKLSNHQKLKLADELWQAGISNTMPVAEPQKRLLNERWASYRTGKSKRLSLAELADKVDRR